MIGQGSNAVTVSGTASTGMTLIATGSNTITWQSTPLPVTINTITTTNNSITPILTISTTDNTTYKYHRSSDICPNRKFICVSDDISISTIGRCFNIKSTSKRC